MANQRVTLVVVGRGAEIFGRPLGGGFHTLYAAPAVKEKPAAVGNQCIGGTSKYFAEFIKQESVKWAEVVKRSGANVDRYALAWKQQVIGSVLTPFPPL